MTTVIRTRLSAISALARAYPGLGALALFVLSAGVYLVNFDPVWSGDLNSNSIFAFNLLEFGTPHLDAFRESHIYKSFGGYSFTIAPPDAPAAGHHTLNYPVGTAVLTFPLYVLFYGYLKAFAPNVGILTAEFEPYRLAFSHVAALMLSAGTVALFFLIARGRATLRIALVATLCLAFATMQWGLLSQSLLQHGASSFAIMTAACLLLRAARSESAWLLLAAGAAAGMLYLIRQTNLIFMLALVVFAVVWFRWRVVPFCVGLAVTGAAALAWNWFYFASLVGAAATSQAHTYHFTPATFVSGLLGLTVSPNHGMFANSPVLLFAVAGAVAILPPLIRGHFRAARADDGLFLLLLGASGVLLASYAFSPFWDGGGSYGTRYVSETMPIIAYFLIPALQRILPSARLAFGVFAALAAIGILNQVTAIVGGQTALAAWASLPIGSNDIAEDRRWDYMWQAPLKSFQSRRWSLADGLNVRIWRGLYANRMLMPQVNATFARYEKCSASIVSVQDNDGKSVDEFRLASVDGGRPYGERLREIFSAGRKFVRARVHNDGPAPLYGFETGLTWGFAALVNKVTNVTTGQVILESGTVYVSGVIEPGKTGDAFGIMDISMTKGVYRIEARMAISGIGYCGPARDLGTVVVD